MQLDTLMTTVKDAIKELNLPWRVRQEDQNIIVEFDELDYVPDGAWGVGLWLKPDTVELLEDQIYSDGEHNENVTYNESFFIEQMQSFREDGKDIPDDETLTADANLIAKHIDQFCDRVSQKEEQWVEDERQRAINLATRIFEECISKATNAMFQFDGMDDIGEAYDADDKGTYWEAWFYYDYLGKEISDDTLALIGTLDNLANASEWESYELEFNLGISTQDDGIHRFLGVDFLLPYKK